MSTIRPVEAKATRMRGRLADSAAAARDAVSGPRAAARVLGCRVATAKVRIIA
jgi:hypothetical protein